MKSAEVNSTNTIPNSFGNPFFFQAYVCTRSFQGQPVSLWEEHRAEKMIYFFYFKPNQKENLGKSSQLSLAQAFCSCPGRARSHLLKQFSVAFRLCTLFLIRNHLLMASSSFHVLPKVGFNKEGLESETIWSNRWNFGLVRHNFCLALTASEANLQ